MSFNVLIVDDSNAMRAVIKKIIAMSGFKMDECREAGNGQGGPGDSVRRMGGCDHFRYQYAGNERSGTARAS